jgi:hypothetical protein
VSFPEKLQVPPLRAARSGRDDMLILFPPFALQRMGHPVFVRSDVKSRSFDCAPYGRSAQDDKF